MSEFENNMSLIYGEEGQKWLESLPRLQDRLAEKFGLRDLKPFADLSYNYVVEGMQSDLPIVLKIGFGRYEIEQEYQATAAFSGHGIVKVLDYSFEDGALLITKANPGATLISLFPARDIQALEIACKLSDDMHNNYKLGDYEFPQLQDWLSIIDREWPGISKEYLELARSLKQDLLANSTKKVLLHGDLHYANVLSDGSNWIMIDPKGVIGDPLYDMTGALLREPFKQVMAVEDLKSLLNSRMQYVASYAKCGVDIIWAWTVVQTVMSICWSLEDKQDFTQKLRFLDVLSKCNEN